MDGPRRMEFGTVSVRYPGGDILLFWTVPESAHGRLLAGRGAAALATPKAELLDLS